MTMDIYDQNTTAWLSTTGSQIFFMQLGFLCYEVGYVKPVWTQSVILKNIEDTFVGVLTFLALGFTLSESEKSWYGIISIPVNPLLIGIDIKFHDQILISAFFASTCATIISGAVLERMKNKAYIVWCLLIILVNYSFVNHWIWHQDGWLNKLGFVDGAGSIVVHSTAGMAALVSVWKLGPRRESIADESDPNRSSDKVREHNKLPPTEHAARPIINAMGAFFLWYGWFAFNVSSPIAFSKGIGDAIGTTALVTVISPICASCSAFIWMWLGFVKLNFESLLSCLLSGLVAITGMCHTCNVWEAAVIGFLASVVYFTSAYVVRYKWHLDDPLQVIAIHLFCGVYSGIAEGIVANDVYDSPGLIFGGFKHFGVQILGVVVVCAFNFCMCLLLWELLLARVLFKGAAEIRVSILDIYLGTRLFDQNYDMALDEVLNCTSNPGKKMLWQFHQYIADRYASEQLDFLIVIKIYNNYLEHVHKLKPDSYKTAKYILQIIDTYVNEKGSQCINISGTNRSILMKIRHQLLYELRVEKSMKDKNEKKEKKENTIANNTTKKDNTTNEFKVEDEGKVEAKDDDYKKLEGIWKGTNTPNMTPVATNDNDRPVTIDIIANDYTINDHDDNANKSASIIKYQSGFYKSGMDITKEKIFNSVYISVWKVVIPHFTQFLRHSYENDKKIKFEVKIPFKLEKNWIIQWDEQLTKDTEAMKLADTVPQYNNSGTLLSKMIDYSDMANGAYDNQRSSVKRNSGIHQIQLSEIENADAANGNTSKATAVNADVIFIANENDKNDKKKDTKVAVIIE